MTSNIYIDIITDDNLKVPGFSYIDEDLYGRRKPMIVLNPKLFPREKNILAHIVAHEWGHHIHKHTSVNPIELTDEEKNKIELEADYYAFNFIKIYKYNITEIINYIKDNHKKNCEKFFKNQNFIEKRLNILYS